MRYNEEERAAVLDAMKPYREQGEALTVAFDRLREEFQREGRKVPNLWTVRKWMAAEDPGKSDQDVPFAGSDADAGRADDYVTRLELVCRMYRRADEYSRDEVCDFLLPELLSDDAERGAR